MNTRIEKDFFFQIALHLNGKFHIGGYDVSLSLLVETDSGREQNIAMDRMAYFLEEVLQNSVLVESNKIDVIQKYRDAGVTVCELPKEPHDQIFGMALLLKLNAIMEGRLKITDMVLGSTFGPGVRYSIVAEDAENAFSGIHWWNKPQLELADSRKPMFDDNILILFDDSDWVNLGLVWKDKKLDAH